MTRTLISSWAYLYGLADPSPIAAQIDAADPEPARFGSGRFRAVSRMLSAATDTIRHIEAGLALAWSAPEPRAALVTVCTAHTDLMADADLRAKACADLAQAVETTQRDTALAWESAGETIRAQGLAAAYFTPEEIDWVTRQRCLLVTGLSATFRRLTASLDLIANSCAAVLAADLSRHLPPGMTIPRSAGADRIDGENRARLAAHLAMSGSAQAAYAAQMLAALTRIEDEGYAAQLLEYSFDGHGTQGTAAISVGDVAAARTVSVVVPGVGNSPAAIGDAADLAADLTWATETVGDGQHATVLWYGYDIPLSWPKDPLPRDGKRALGAMALDTERATNATTAMTGGAQLGEFTRTLREIIPTSAGLTLIGHSYGSAVVSQAARSLDEQSGVTDIVLLGSPGAGYDVATAADYPAVSPGHVYTLGFAGDAVTQPVTDLLATVVNPLSMIFGGGIGQPFGSDPNSPQFGGQRIRPVPEIKDPGFLHLSQHALSHYLSGFGLTAVAEISAGQYGNVDLLMQDQ